MPLYAIVENGNTVREYRTYDAQPPNPAGKPSIKILPVVDNDSSITDPDTQVKEGPTVVITATEVTRTWTVRNKTAGELTAEKDAKVEGLDKAILTVLFNHENRIRTLNSQSTVTVNQFKNAIKALL
jgi:hypothetical protein